MQILFWLFDLGVGICSLRNPFLQRARVQYRIGTEIAYQSSELSGCYLLDLFFLI